MTSAKRKIGVLVMSYGTPESLDQIEEYYTHIRRGVPPSKEQLEELKNRYEAIVGGFFPLRKNTDKQVAALQHTLNSLYPETEYVCFQGLKHARPYIEDGVEAMAAAGIREAVGVVLAPHYSVMSVGDYIKRAERQAEQSGISIRFVRDYHDHPLLIEAHSEKLRHALERFPAEVRGRVRVMFSAHSLPEKILEMNDPYVDQLLETSRLIAAKTGVTDWQFAWQSAGQTSMPWLGPDILDVLETIHREEGTRHVVVCPMGFVSDHLEVLYDLDIELKQLADKLGIRFERTEMLNTDPRYMKLLAEVVHGHG